MSRGTDRRTVRVAPELWGAARAVADNNGETVSDIIRTALEAYTTTMTNTKPQLCATEIANATDPADPYYCSNVGTWQDPDGTWYCDDHAPTVDAVAFDNDEDRFGPQD